MSILDRMDVLQEKEPLPRIDIGHCPDWLLISNRPAPSSVVGTDNYFETELKYRPNEIKEKIIRTYTTVDDIEVELFKGTIKKTEEHTGVKYGTIRQLVTSGETSRKTGLYFRRYKEDNLKK